MACSRRSDSGRGLLDPVIGVSPPRSRRSQRPGHLGRPPRDLLVGGRIAAGRRVSQDKAGGPAPPALGRSGGAGRGRISLGELMAAVDRPAWGVARTGHTAAPAAADTSGTAGPTATPG